MANDRLLTPIERVRAANKGENNRLGGAFRTDIPGWALRVVEAQRAISYPAGVEEGRKQANIECQARMEKIFEEIEEHCQTCDKGGNPIILIDFIDSQGKQKEVSWWKTLKQKYLKEAEGGKE